MIKNSKSKSPLQIDRRSFMGRLAAMGGVIASGGVPAISQAVASVDKPTPRPPHGVTASDDTVVEIDSGRIRGFQRNGIFAFKGVPYGESTGGKNRFKRAVRPQPWRGIRNALQFGRACPQTNGDSAHFNYDGQNLASRDEDAFLLHRGSGILIPGEDCLRLNVWTPAISGPAGRPVMVYMHGGGFEVGFDMDLASYDGENLARNDVVVVTHNHRLNVFGYLDLSAAGGAAFEDSANIGLLDLVSVLQWVKLNIHAFGGDPRNVTIFGQSGGGGKVAALMAIPEAKGLFHRAIIQSGPMLKAHDKEFSQRVASQVLSELGVGSNLEQLQDIPVDRLSGAAAEAMRKLSTKPAKGIFKDYHRYGWGPTVDGVVLPHDPFDPGAPLESADVPLLTGSIFHEVVSGLDHSDATRMTEAEAANQLRDRFGDFAGDILGAYRSEYPNLRPFDVYAAINAAEFRRCAKEQASRKSRLNRAPAFLYLYAWRTPQLNDTPGSFHACEISFVFDNAELCDHYSGLQPEALELAKQISGAWVSFARSGNPSHPGIPEWPTYRDETEPCMVFNSPCRIQQRVESEGLKLVQRALT